MEAKIRVGKRKRISGTNSHLGANSNGLASVGVIPYTPNSIASRGVKVRADGLRVFLDGDRALDYIRLNERDPRKVILAVAIRRAQQVACNYTSKHAPELYQDIVKLTGGTKTLTFKGEIK